MCLCVGVRVGVNLEIILCFISFSAFPVYFFLFLLSNSVFKISVYAIYIIISLLLNIAQYPTEGISSFHLSTPLVIDNQITPLPQIFSYRCSINP